MDPKPENLVFCMVLVKIGQVQVVAMCTAWVLIVDSSKLWWTSFFVLATAGAQVSVWFQFWLWASVLYAGTGVVWVFGLGATYVNVCVCWIVGKVYGLGFGCGKVYCVQELVWCGFWVGGNICKCMCVC